MNKDDIIRMAREAGGYTTEHYPDEWRLDVDDLDRFADLVAAAEREACAQVCEAIAQEMYDQGEGPTGYISWVADCHSRIRARGHK